MVIPNDCTRPPQNSATYPYFKVNTGANTLKGAELIPYKILTYLMDMPDSYGYTPPTSNDYPRTRLLRYLWNDGARPLDGEYPSITQKSSMLFDPKSPDINTDELKAKHPKGYRLFTQRVIGQSELDAKTLIKCYVGRIYEIQKFITSIGIIMEIWTNVNFVTNTKTTAYDRTFDMEQCVREALDGVNISGIGTVSFDRMSHSQNGSDILYDEAQNVGRIIHFSLTWAEGGENTATI